ncbi:universal stress protein [Rubrobacter aplysinae]|uniref:universal stress protein n=1 Tax=Rubrobacter aplysinae TaxID=909625 RepID=UPI00064B9F79|nr:universal stress protein [Rubrobacter aplysinae]
MSTLSGKILLATDGSEEAGSAARIAAELCEKAGSELHLVYVGPHVARPGDLGPVIFDPQVSGKAQDRLDQASQELLDEQVQAVTEAGGSVAEAYLRTEENPAAEIVHLAEEIGASAIIMGSRGRGGIRRALMGSVSENVVLYAHCPVLVVRGDGRRSLFPARIVLAVDGSEESKAATDTAIDLVKRTGSELYVVHAGFTAYLPYAHPYMAENVESFAERAEKEAREFLENRVEQIKDQANGQTGARVHTHLRRGDPKKEIVELAEEVDAGLVIIGSRGLGGVRRALMGGVSDSVVRHAHCPVLVVRTEHDEA